MFPNRNGLLFIPFISKRKNKEEDNFARLLYVLPHFPSDSMRILISNIHCPLSLTSLKERTFASINLCACHLRIDATLFLCLHLPSLPSKPQFPLCALSAPTKEKTASPLILFRPTPVTRLLATRHPTTLPIGGLWSDVRFCYLKIDF